MNVKDLGLILDLNQPLIYEESVVKKSILDFYNPLVRVLKAYKNLNFSINIPLSTLEMFDKLGGSSFITDLKDLYQNERIEIINSSPFGLPLSGLPKNIVESQIILNEYGLGYYLGSTKGFEGEPSIMIRDTSGFFPEKYSLDEDSLKVLGDFGYSWFAVRGEDSRKDIVKVLLKDSDLKAVSVFEDLNKLVYPKKSLIDNESGDRDIVVNGNEGADNISMLVKIEEILKSYSGTGIENIVFQIVNPNYNLKSLIDYKDVLNKIESILDALSRSNCSVKSVGDIVKSKNKIETIELSDYCKSMSGINTGKKLTEEFKFKTVNIDGKILKDIDERLSFIFNSDKKYESSTIKIWDIEEIKAFNDIQLRNNMSFLLFISKIIPLIEIKQSNLEIGSDENLNNKENFAKKLNSVISELLSYIEDPEIINLFKNYI